MPLVTTYLGVDIHVEHDGRFWARVAGKYVDDRAMSRIKTLIRTTAPTVQMMRRKNMSAPEFETINVAAIEQHGAHTMAVTPAVNSSYYPTKSYALSEVYEYDQAAMDRAEELKKEFGKRYRDLDKERIDAMESLVAALPLVNAERLAELLATVRAERETD